MESPIPPRNHWDTNDLQEEWNSSSYDSSLPNQSLYQSPSFQENQDSYSSVIIHNLSPTTRSLLSQPRLTHLTTDKNKSDPVAWKRSRLKDIFSPIELETLFLPNSSTQGNATRDRVETDARRENGNASTELEERSLEDVDREGLGKLNESSSDDVDKKLAKSKEEEERNPSSITKEEALFTQNTAASESEDVKNEDLEREHQGTSIASESEDVNNEELQREHHTKKGTSTASESEDANADNEEVQGEYLTKNGTSSASESEDVEKEELKRELFFTEKGSQKETTAATPKHRHERFSGFTTNTLSPIYPLRAPSSPSFSYTPAHVTSGHRGVMGPPPKYRPDFGVGEPRLLVNRPKKKPIHLENVRSEASLAPNDEMNDPALENTREEEINDIMNDCPTSPTEETGRPQEVVPSTMSSAKHRPEFGLGGLRLPRALANRHKKKQNPLEDKNLETSLVLSEEMKEMNGPDMENTREEETNVVNDRPTSPTEEIGRPQEISPSTMSSVKHRPDFGLGELRLPRALANRQNKKPISLKNNNSETSLVPNEKVKERNEEYTRESEEGVDTNNCPPSRTEETRRPQEQIQSTLSSASSSLSAYTHPLPHDRLFQNDYDTLTRRRLTALVSQLDNDFFAEIQTPSNPHDEETSQENASEEEPLRKEKRQVEPIMEATSTESIPETKTPRWALPVESNGISGEGTVYAIAEENRDKRIKLIPLDSELPNTCSESTPSSSPSSSFQSSRFPSSNARSPDPSTSQSRRTTVTEEDMTTASVLARARMLMNTIRHQEHSRTNSISSSSSRLGESVLHATLNRRREYSGPSISEEMTGKSISRGSLKMREEDTAVLDGIGDEVDGNVDADSSNSRDRSVESHRTPSSGKGSPLTAEAFEDDGIVERIAEKTENELKDGDEIFRKAKMERDRIESVVHVSDQGSIEISDAGSARSKPTIPILPNDADNDNIDDPLTSLSSKPTPSLVVNNCNLNVDMTVITPLDLPHGSLPEQVGTMVYDPLNMRWIDISGEDDDSDPFGSCEDVVSEGEGSFDSPKERDDQPGTRSQFGKEEVAMSETTELGIRTDWVSENEVSELGISPRPNPVRDGEEYPFLDQECLLDASGVLDEEEEEGNGTLEVGQKTACLMRAFKSLEDIGPEDLLPDRTITFLSAPASPRGRTTPTARPRDQMHLSPIKLEIPPIPETPVRRIDMTADDERDAELVEKRLLEQEPCRDSWPALKEIRCDDLGVESVAVLEELLGSGPDCECLVVDDNRLNYLTGIPVSLVTLSIRNNCLTNLTGFGLLPNLQYLDVSGNAIENLTGLSCLRHLRELCADDNGIVECDWLGVMTGLLRVSLRGNKIEKIDLGPCHLHSLESLDLAHNKIQTFEGLESCTGLASVNLDNNEVRTIRLFKPLSNLRTLRMSHNPFPGPLDLTLFPLLRTLHADAGRLSRHAVCGLKSRKLEGVSLRAHESGNLELEFKQFRMARKLFLSGNSLLSIEKLQGFLNLEILELCDIGLRQLPLNFAKQAPNLQSLNLSHNPLLADLLPLRKMRGLSRLRAIGCGVREPIVVAQVARGCENLKVLDVRHNPLTEKLYPPLPAPTPLERSCLQPYPPTGEEWAFQDAAFVRDATPFPRIAYRSVILAHATTKLQELDGVLVTEKERRDAPSVEAKLREAAKVQVRNKEIVPLRKQLGGPGQRMQDRVLGRGRGVLQPEVIGKSNLLVGSGRIPDERWKEGDGEELVRVGRNVGEERCTESEWIGRKDPIPSVGTQIRCKNGRWSESGKTKDRENSDKLARIDMQTRCDEGRRLESGRIKDRESTGPSVKVTTQTRREDGRWSEMSGTKDRENSDQSVRINTQIRREEGRWAGMGRTADRDNSDQAVRIITQTRREDERWSERSRTEDRETSDQSVKLGTQTRCDGGRWSESGRTKDRENLGPLVRVGLQTRCEDGRSSKSKDQENPGPSVKVNSQTWYKDGRWSQTGRFKECENLVPVGLQARCENERTLVRSAEAGTNHFVKARSENMIPMIWNSKEARNDSVTRERQLLAKWTALRHCGISMEKERRQTLAMGDCFWIPWDNNHRTLERRSKTMSPQRDRSLLGVSTNRGSSFETDNATTQLSLRNTERKDQVNLSSTSSTTPFPTFSTLSTSKESLCVTSNPRQEEFPPPQPPASLVPRMEEWESRRRLWHEIMGQQFSLKGDARNHGSEGKEGFYVRVTQVSEEF